MKHKRETESEESVERENSTHLHSPLPANARASLNHVAYQCCCAVMLFRQPCRPVLRSRISSAFTELETRSPPRLSPPLHAPLNDMYPEDNRGSGRVANVDFLEGTYDYAPTPTPLYTHSTTGYYSAPLDTHGPPSDSSLQSLGSGSTSPLVFVPSSTRLSPFMHPPSQHYLETTATPIYR